MERKHAFMFAPLFCILSLVFFGCSTAEIRRVRELQIHHIDLSRVKDGSYQGDFAYGRFRYAVMVTVKDQSIADIAILQNRMTKHAKMAAGVVKKILEQQKNDVDAVSGATTTSKALLKAIENALTKGE